MSIKTVYIFASITSAASAKWQKWKWHATKNSKSHIVPFFLKKIYHLFVSIFCLYPNVDMFGCHNDWNKIEISSGKLRIQKKTIFFFLEGNYFNSMIKREKKLI